MATSVSRINVMAEPPLAEIARLFAPIALASREAVVFAHFDPEWRLLGIRHIASPKRDAVAVRLDDLLLDTSAFGSTVVVMAHNHPSGDSTPSIDDHTLTRRVARALEALQVRLVDHLVLAPGRLVSFRARGWL